MTAGFSNLLAFLLGWKAAHGPATPPCFVAAAAIFVSGAEAGQCRVN